MMVELIGAANDVCMLCGICFHLGEHPEDLEGRPSIGLTPTVSELGSSSQPARETFSCVTLQWQETVRHAF